MNHRIWKTLPDLGFRGPDRQAAETRKSGVRQRSPISRALELVLALVALAPGNASFAQICLVPSGTGSIQEAVDDPSCLEIFLATGAFSESVAISRSLILAGDPAAGSVIAGGLLVSGPGVEVELQELRIESSCPQGTLVVASGARVDGMALESIRDSGLSCPPFSTEIFADGFESGSTSAWSGTVP